MPKIAGINHQDAVRALQKAAFRVVRQGKHIVMSDVKKIGDRGRFAEWNQELKYNNSFTIFKNMVKFITPL